MEEELPSRWVSSGCYAPDPGLGHSCYLELAPGHPVLLQSHLQQSRARKHGGGHRGTEVDQADLPVQELEAAFLRILV